MPGTVFFSSKCAWHRFFLAPFFLAPFFARGTAIRGTGFQPVDHSNHGQDGRAATEAQSYEWRLTTAERKRILTHHIFGVD
ncbi:MAG: hypothetical protein ACOC7K_00980, partial [bacterium]